MARRVRGVLGIGLRYSLLAALAEETGDNVLIAEDVYLLGSSKMRIGSNVSIHPMSYVDGTGGLDIGNDVSIAHGATILSTTHAFDMLEVPIKDQGVLERRTTIGDDCWIGAQAVLIAGVTIGEGSVIAANSVVTRPVPPRTIVAGSPARRVRTRE